MKRGNRHLQAAINEVVENQLRDPSFPEVKEAYERMLREGISEQEARRLLACLVLSEAHGVLGERRLFDRERYVESLRRLPKLPGEE